MENLTLVIGNCNYSSWSLRPWLFLQQHQIPFHEQRVTLSESTTLEQLSSFFSGDKVPILITGEQQIWDSLAILEYLAESFPECAGWPADAKARAVARSVSAEMHSSFFNLRGGMPMNCRKRFPGFPLTPEIQADVDRICEIWRYCREQFGQNGPWLFGDFSIADCMYAPVVIRFVGYDVALDPVSQAYADHLYNTPSLQAWINCGKAEIEVIEEEEVDWNSEPV
ncbi:MAG: glutathione S-transferase family protein [Chromatiales bacterium]|nr:glutathione S-transferase family protein [Chromatiales bacterium]